MIPLLQSIAFSVDLSIRCSSYVMEEWSWGGIAFCQ